MALILNIDTSVQTGSICLAKDSKVIGFLENKEQRQQASWLHKAIGHIMAEADARIESLNAVAVSNGPGSYTGLRISLSTAKGICYALGIPLICVNTLTIMASAVTGDAEDLICPMIDARRMEVFTALYHKDLNIIEQPKALILQEGSFSKILAHRKILFTGNGSIKSKSITNNHNARFVNYDHNALDLIPLSLEMYKQSQFADLAYAEPEYLKAVYTK